MQQDLTSCNVALEICLGLKCSISTAFSVRQVIGLRETKVLCEYRLGRLPTLEEEARHNLKELWPEGVVLIADAATLHAAASHPGSQGRASLLEEVKLHVPHHWLTEGILLMPMCISCPITLE